MDILYASVIDLRYKAASLRLDLSGGSLRTMYKEVVESKHAQKLQANITFKMLACFLNNLLVKNN